MAATNTVKCQTCGYNYWRHGVDKRACDCWNPRPAEELKTSFSFALHTNSETKDA